MKMPIWRKNNRRYAMKRVLPVIFWVKNKAVRTIRSNKGACPYPVSRKITITNRCFRFNLRVYMSCFISIYYRGYDYAY